MKILGGGIKMADNKKLIIQPPKYKEETTIISMRLPKDMLAAIDKVVAETGRNRNEILMLSIDFALENMEIVKR